LAAASVIPVAERLRACHAGERIETTLLALVQALSEVTEDDREIVATVLDLLRRGRVRLIGTFRDQILELD